MGVRCSFLALPSLRQRGRRQTSPGTTPPCNSGLERLDAHLVDRILAQLPRFEDRLALVEVLLDGYPSQLPVTAVVGALVWPPPAALDAGVPIKDLRHTLACARGSFDAYQSVHASLLQALRGRWGRPFALLAGGPRGRRPEEISLHNFLLERAVTAVEAETFRFSGAADSRVQWAKTLVVAAFAWVGPTGLPRQWAQQMERHLHLPGDRRR